MAAKRRREPEPDFLELRRLAAVTQARIDAGTWDRAAFEELFAAAKKAADGEEELLEFLLNEADATWL